MLGKIKNKLFLLILPLLFLSCGKNNKIWPDKNSSQSYSNSSTYESDAPAISGLFYLNNGTYAKISYPFDQTASYEFQFCEDSSYTQCSRVITVDCTAPGKCVKSGIGSIANSSGSPAGTYSVTLVNQPIGKTFYVRVKAYNAKGEGRWITSSTCSSAKPARCSGGSNVYN